MVPCPILTVDVLVAAAAIYLFPLSKGGHLEGPRPELQSLAGVPIDLYTVQIYKKWNSHKQRQAEKLTWK